MLMMVLFFLLFVPVQDATVYVEAILGVHKKCTDSVSECLSNGDKFVFQAVIDLVSIQLHSFISSFIHS